MIYPCQRRCVRIEDSILTGIERSSKRICRSRRDRFWPALARELPYLRDHFRPAAWVPGLPLLERSPNHGVTPLPRMRSTAVLCIETAVIKNAVWPFVPDVNAGNLESA